MPNRILVIQAGDAGNKVGTVYFDKTADRPWPQGRFELGH
jgi:hypothetical protein